jgi:peptidoglycan/LPS O-acetylase OafA/YrhL
LTAASGCNRSKTVDFREDIQGLRAVAVVGVVAFHGYVPWMRGGYVGVDVFYVISGFLITGLLLRDAARSTRGRALVDFYARRARRILPAAATVIVGTLVMALIFESSFDQARAADGARSAALFYANVRYAGAGGYFGPTGHELFQQYWSLSVEEQFYAAWPLVFLAVSAVAIARYRQRALLAVVAVASVASFALNIAWVYDNGWLTVQPTRAFFLLPTRVWELGIGALLALLAPQLEAIGARARQVLLISGLAAIAAAMVTLSPRTPFPGWAALLPTLGTAAVLASGIGAARVASPILAVLTNRVSQLLGRYSYSLYLWHWPIVLLVGPKVGGPWVVRFAFVGGLSLVAAVVTFHIVEDPLRHARALRARPSVSLGLGAITVAVCVLVALLVNDRAIDSMNGGSLTRVAAVEALSPTNFVPKGLRPELPRARTTHAGHRCDSHCVTHRSGAGTIAFFGDSHLEHFGPGLEAAADRLRVTSLQDWKYGCPWFAVIPWRNSIDRCRTYRDETFARYRAHPPDVIVLSSRNDTVRRSNAAAWEAGIRRSLALLPRASRVVVLGDTPAAKQFVPRCLASHLRDTRPCEPRWPDDVNAQLKAIVESAGATFVDLRPAFCVAARCPAISGTTLIWADDDHVTAKFAESLGPWFAAVLRPLLPAPR